MLDILRHKKIMLQSAVILILVLPTIIVILKFGPFEVLRFNALSAHDGMRYFEVSLDPVGTTQFCPEPVRYSRILFPSLYFF